jgi:hypothetical protein
MMQSKNFVDFARRKHCYLAYIRDRDCSMILFESDTASLVLEVGQTRQANPVNKPRD